jgi:hypothetical protein
VRRRASKPRGPMAALRQAYRAHRAAMLAANYNTRFRPSAGGWVLQEGKQSARRCPAAPAPPCRRRNVAGAQTHDAVLALGAGFVACIANTGAAFVDLFELENAAVTLTQHRAVELLPFQK